MWNSAVRNFVSVSVIGVTLAINSYANNINNNGLLTVVTPQYRVNIVTDSGWSTNGVIIRDTDDSKIICISEMLQHIKINLGLPNKDIAAMLGVTRQTLHNYMNTAEDKQTININERVRLKVTNLYDIVDEFHKELPHSPGAMAKNYLFNGQSLLELLSADNLEKDKISSLYTALSNKFSSTAYKDATINNKTLYQLTKHA